MKEHIESIKDKYMDLAVMDRENFYYAQQLDQLIKAIAVYIVKRDGPYD